MIIDWSKAPEGATHYNMAAAGNHRPYSWMQLLDGEWFYYRRYCWERQHDVFPDKHDQLVERPSTWTGEGLPPVGTTCEWHPSVHGWIEVTILGRDGEDTWYRAKGESRTETCRNMAFFRPIRTPEQIAAEERDKAVRDIQGLGGIQRQSAEWIYDAGYRKQVAA